MELNGTAQYTYIQTIATDRGTEHRKTSAIEYENTKRKDQNLLGQVPWEGQTAPMPFISGHLSSPATGGIESTVA